MKLTFDDVGRPCSSQELAEFEEQIGATLPSDYRHFLSTINGGMPHPDCMQFSRYPGNRYLGDGPTQSTLLAAIFGLRHEHALSLSEFVTSSVDRIPTGMIPIAFDQGGNFVLLSISGDHVGTVYFWDHEEEADVEEGETASMRNVYYVADTFQDFLDNIYEYIPDDETLERRLVRTNDMDGLVKLVNGGYGLETLDRNGRTLLENATIKGRVDIVKYLLSRGAELRDARRYAEQNGHLDLLDVLTSSG